MTDKEQRYNNLYMDIADRVAQMSYAVRAKIGCVIVNNGQIIATGFNGMPAGMQNECEHYDISGVVMVTNPEVSHAEENAIGKIARSTLSSEGSTAYITMSPCIHCAKLLFTSGISKVFYRDSYRISDGVEFLRNRNVHVEQLQ